MPLNDVHRIPDTVEAAFVHVCVHYATSVMAQRDGTAGAPGASAVERSCKSHLSASGDFCAEYAELVHRRADQAMLTSFCKTEFERLRAHRGLLHAKGRFANKEAHGPEAAATAGQRKCEDRFRGIARLQLPRESARKVIRIDCLQHFGVELSSCGEVVGLFEAGKVEELCQLLVPLSREPSEMEAFCKRMTGKVVATGLEGDALKEAAADLCAMEFPAPAFLLRKKPRIHSGCRFFASQLVEAHLDASSNISRFCFTLMQNSTGRTASKSAGTSTDQANVTTLSGMGRHESTTSAVANSTLAGVLAHVAAPMVTSSGPAHGNATLSKHSSERSSLKTASSGRSGRDAQLTKLSKSPAAAIGRSDLNASADPRGNLLSRLAVGHSSAPEKVLPLGVGIPHAVQSAVNGEITNISGNRTGSVTSGRRDAEMNTVGLDDNLIVPQGTAAVFSVPEESPTPNPLIEIWSTGLPNGLLGLPVDAEASKLEAFKRREDVQRRVETLFGPEVASMAQALSAMASMPTPMPVVDAAAPAAKPNLPMPSVRITKPLAAANASVAAQQTKTGVMADQATVFADASDRSATSNGQESDFLSNFLEQYDSRLTGGVAPQLQESSTSERSQAGQVRSALALVPGAMATPDVDSLLSSFLARNI